MAGSSTPYPDGARSFARLPHLRTPTPRRIAVVSDLHFSTVESGTSKQLHRTGTHLQTFVRDVNDRDVDAVLCLGDLAQRGRPADFERLTESLADLDPPFYAVPGNHDLSTYERAEGLALSAFAERFGTGSYPLSVSAGDLTLFGFPAIAGDLDAAALSRLAAACSAPAGAILCMHFPTAPVIERLRETLDTPSIIRTRRIVRGLSAALDSNAVPLVLTGHLHVPLAARSGDRTHISAPPLCTYPQGYLLVRTGPSGSSLSFVPVADGRTLERTRTARASHGTADRLLADVAADVVRSLPPVDATDRCHRSPES